LWTNEAKTIEYRKPIIHKGFRKGKKGGSGEVFV